MRTRSQVMPACGEPGGGSVPERDRGDGGLVVVDLGVHESGAVIDGGVDVAVTDPGVAAGGGRCRGRGSPAAAVGDPGDLLDVDMDQLAGTVALVAAHWFGSVARSPSIEPAEALGVEDRLHRRRRQAELVGDVIGAPTTLAAQTQHPVAT